MVKIFGMTSFLWVVNDLFLENLLSYITIKIYVVCAVYFFLGGGSIKLFKNIIVKKKN